MTLHIDGDVSLIEVDLEHLDRALDGKAVALLDTVLELAFEITQHDVHIDTTSLKGSGRHHSEVNRTTQTWSGMITYGGVTTGPKNPVNYAIYEKARGGTHDFFRGLDALHEMFIAAVLEAMME